jgi:isoleucyl-tRNA synthetase
MDYRFTLNLPETNFSMKANLSLNENDILKFWDDINLYNKKSFNKKIFVLNDGPPYSNGDIHIGHAFNKILKDIVCKFKRLDGFFVNFVPGWDCHGLPIELNVEKIIKKSKFLVSDSDFRSLCKKYADEQIFIQRSSFIRLGINASWNDFYQTMDFKFEAAIVKTFRSLLENGYIYSSIRPVYWCFDCTSALADAELEYLDKQSDSIYVFFEIFDFENFFDKFYFRKIGFVIWTTTPWTLPFNEAMALNPKAEYVLIAHKEIGYIFDKKLLDFVVKKLSFNRIHVLHTFSADFFLNMRIIHPIYSKFVKVVLSDHVSSDSGTGCVHIAPGYGYDDYKVALKFGLPIQNKVDVNGYFYGDVEDFSSLNIKDVNPNVVSKLKEKNNLLLHECILHRYPHCWRHKSSLIFRTTNQWFLSVGNKLLCSNVINMSKNFIRWIPENGKTKILSMMNDRPDWCISRQRVWGVPIFLFVNKNDDSLHPRSLFILDEIIELIKNDGTNFWYECDVFSYFNVDPILYRKVTDVLDVWYDSSSVYEFILNKFNFLKIPFDLCLEGNDQYRGWFQASLINSVANYNLFPFKTIVAHGFVLDGFGRKMSKSLNNVVSPNDVIKIYGADVLRLWVSSVNYCFDVNISEEILSRVCESYRKIRNTFRFFLSNVYDFNPETNLVMYCDIFYIDKWILKKFVLFKDDIIRDFNEYKFYSVYKKIYNFCIDELGSKYFEIVKDRLYLTRSSSIFRLSCQSTLYYILYEFVKLISPILSFTAEEIWKNIKYVVNSVHASIFDLKVNLFLTSEFFNVCDLIFFDKLFYIKDYVNKIIERFRHEFNIGSSLELDLYFYCNIYWFNFLLKLKNDLFLFFLVSKVNCILDAKSDGFHFEIVKSKFFKCERCWHRNLHKFNELKICNRCILNIYYFKECRRFF